MYNEPMILDMNLDNSQEGENQKSAQGKINNIKLVLMRVIRE